MDSKQEPATTKEAWDELFSLLIDHTQSDAVIDRADVIRAAETLARLLRAGGPLPRVD